TRLEPSAPTDYPDPAPYPGGRRGDRIDCDGWTALIPSRDSAPAPRPHPTGRPTRRDGPRPPSERRARPGGARHPAPHAPRRRKYVTMASATAILNDLRAEIDVTDFRKLHWEGSFADYLSIVLETPGVTRTAYQRLYDMILAHGTEDVYENK